jgi:hypothetical protein
LNPQCLCGTSIFLCIFPLKFISKLFIFFELLLYVALWYLLLFHTFLWVGKRFSNYLYAFSKSTYFRSYLFAAIPSTFFFTLLSRAH